MHTGEGAARLRHVAEALLGNHHARLAVLLQVPARPTSVYACTYQLACQSEDAFLQKQEGLRLPQYTVCDSDLGRISAQSEWWVTLWVIQVLTRDN